VSKLVSKSRTVGKTDIQCVGRQQLDSPFLHLFAQRKKINRKSTKITKTALENGENATKRLKFYRKRRDFTENAQICPKTQRKRKENAQILPKTLKFARKRKEKALILPETLRFARKRKEKARILPKMLRFCPKTLRFY